MNVLITLLLFLCITTYVYSKSVLIHENTVTAGVSSLEFKACVENGFTVDIVTDSTWQTMSQTQFASYDLLVIGDPSCADISYALANSGVWASVVMASFWKSW